ncbi:MAG: NAD(P)H-dependent oxidoreductase [Mucilaginibacter sp.]|uniref:FMN-dependent NADH-azoreductase n=1 Tax=Mucilaginibacter sp. TaxID=1882438 RepID=UPI0032643A09
MKKILHIISSPRKGQSFSIKLGNAIVDKIQAKYPGSMLTEVNLIDKQFPHLEEVHLQSFFTPAESRSPELIEAVKHSDEAIQQIKDADIIVIGAGMYNFSIHSSLKAWIDHIVRKDITFYHDETGFHGLIKGKKVYIALSSGGVYTEGPMQAMDFRTPYLKALLSTLGMSDITQFAIEGTNIPGIQDTAVEKGLNSIVID